MKKAISSIANHLQYYDPEESFSDFARQYENEILQLEEYKKFMDIVHNDPVASKHFDKQVGTFLYMFYLNPKNICTMFYQN
jgi:hypothetical protein